MMVLTAVSLLWAVFALGFTVMGHQYPGYNFGVDTASISRRWVQTNQPFVFNRLGSVGNDEGDLPLRREIRDLEQNQDQWTLYILGLSMMQFTNQTDPTSWYQITGIHGVPFVTWGGVKPTPGNENTGYCTHISVLFPTWHRPYLSMYENILYSLMVEIADLWPDEQERQRYQKAVVNFRIPYWDWAANRTANGTFFPRSIGGSSTLQVNGPNGVQTIANPLFNYRFKPLDRSDFLLLDPWDVWSSTVRAPTSNESSAESNNTVVESLLSQNIPSIQQRLYNLFSNHDNYTTFSNSAWIPDLNNASYDSLESLHDTVHSIAGGLSGHMAYIPFSAFDPIFFLHHANVDRLFAMWQALYPDSWIVPYPAIMNSYTTSLGEIQDSKTNLTPFYAKSDGTFYNSDMVRDPKSLGYSYAEVAGFTLGPGANKTLQRRVRTAINRLYGSSSVVNIARKLKEESGSKSSTNSLFSTLMVDGRYREWIANIRVNKQGLGGPFSIHLFLDKIPADSMTWSHAPDLVGTLSVFAAPRMPGISMTSHNVSGTVPLTVSLAKKVMSGALSDFEPGNVSPYLKGSLKVAVIQADGVVIDVASVPSLKVHIVSASVRAPQREDELPAWDSTVVSHFDLL